MGVFLCIIFTYFYVINTHNMIRKEESTQIGFIQKTHGVKGELTLALIEELDYADLEADFLYLDIDNGLVPFYVESYRIKSTKNVLIKLESVDSENRANELCGIAVFADSELLKAQDQLSDAEFVGYRVFDKTKGYIGNIKRVLDIENNPLFALDFEGKEILFPINADFIIAADDAEKTLQVDLPEGLVDLYLAETEDEDDFA